MENFKKNLLKIAGKDATLETLKRRFWLKNWSKRCCCRRCTQPDLPQMPTLLISQSFNVVIFFIENQEGGICFTPFSFWKFDSCTWPCWKAITFSQLIYWNPLCSEIEEKNSSVRWFNLYLHWHWPMNVFNIPPKPILKHVLVQNFWRSRIEYYLN